MKKALSLLALGTLGTLAANAQNSFAGYYLLEGKTVAFAKPATTSYIAAYSSPQGGKVIKEDGNCPAGEATLWPFEKGNEPAFLLLRPDGQTTANVVSLETPLFNLSGVVANTGLLPTFNCTAFSGDEPVSLQIRKWNAGGTFEIVKTFPLAATATSIHFQPATEAAQGIYEARMMYGGTELWKSEPFGGGDLTANLLPYPNPTRNGQFTLFTPAGGTLIMKDIKGSTVLEQPLKDGLNSLFLPAALSSGVYTGQLKTEGAQETQSFRLHFMP